MMIVELAVKGLPVFMSAFSYGQRTTDKPISAGSFLTDLH
jgi:hypothetical protein